MQTMNECVQALKGHDRFVILTHIRPDGDTLCSAAALCSALRRLGKQAALYRNPGVTERYQPMVEPYLGESDPGAYVVSVDVADVTMFPPGWEGNVDLVIDHHPANPGFGAINHVDGSKASCGEIVMALILTLCGDLTKEEANLLYVAVSTDSGCFCYGNTKAETLRAAAQLIDCGAENAKLNKQFFRSDSFARLKLEGMVYAELQSFRDHKINVAVITREMMETSGADEGDCDDLASLPGRVRGNVVGITIRELAEDECKVSLRTNDQVDAAAVCARFVGGGHKMAAGCTLNTSPDIAALLMLSVINEIWPE